MRVEAIAAAALVLVVLAPGAVGILAIQGEGPVRDRTLAPQLHCEILYDRAGIQRCDVYGRIGNANELRLRMSGAGEVFAFLDDNADPTISRQLAVLDCDRSCVTGFRLTSTDAAALYIYTSGAAGTLISVTVGRGIGTEML